MGVFCPEGAEQRSQGNAWESGGRLHPAWLRPERAKPSRAHAGPPSMSVVSPCAILTSSAWLTVHAVLCVTASTSPAADGCPLPLFLTPPKGKCTSAPMHGKLT